MWGEKHRYDYRAFRDRNGQPYYGYAVKRLLEDAYEDRKAEKIVGAWILVVLVCIGAGALIVMYAR